MSTCPDDKLIHRYLNGRCNKEEITTIEDHLDQCDLCRCKVAALRESQAYKDKNMIDANATVDSSSDYDQFRTESMPDVSVFDSKEDAVAVSLETMTDGYKVIGILPRGGQAVVFKATQKATRRMVAVKVLLQGQNASKYSRFRFEQEIELVAGLKHPNIVTIYDSGIAEGQYYYAMEYIDGKPLDEYVEGNDLTTRQCLELFGKITSAIAYAHQHGVIHRDLKPGNILVDRQGQPHVLDFGLAKLADGFETSYEKTLMTSLAGQILGTLAYMSPEQATADPEAIDVRTDVYSLGVILYRLLTGKFPYPIGGPMFDILQNIKQQEAVKPSKLIPKLNSEVEAIILKALTKEPEHRYQSAVELHHDIQYWLEGLPISARSDNTLYVLRKLILRHRYSSAVAALLLVIILSFSFISFKLYMSARENYHNWKNIADQYKETYEKDQQLAQQIIFNLFIESWRNDENTAEGLLGLFGAISDQNPKLSNAARFLVNDEKLAVKEQKFRNLMSENNLWFADYVIGEYYLKSGDAQQAAKLFKNSIMLISKADSRDHQPEEWLVERIENKLRQLGQP